ncbi:MAG: DUF2752 domain-containing protein [Rikenellaceae bacterium]
MIVVIYITYSCVDPLDAAWMPKCFTYQWFGIRCPGCGTQRALHSLLSGDLKAAFFYNPLMVLSVPYLLMAIVLDSKSIRAKHPKLHQLFLGERAIWLLLAVLLIYTIVRNYFEF